MMDINLSGKMECPRQMTGQDTPADQNQNKLEC